MASGATFRIHKKFNFDQNQLKRATQYNNVYTYQKKFKMKNFLLAKFGQKADFGPIYA